MSKKVFWTPTPHGIVVPLPVRKELGVQETSENIKEEYSQRNRGVILCVALFSCCLQNKTQTRASRPSLPLISLRKARTSLPKNSLVKSRPQTPHSTRSNSQSQKQQLHNRLQIRKLRGTPTAADTPGLPYSWSSLQVGYSGGAHT